MTGTPDHAEPGQDVLALMEMTRERVAFGGDARGRDPNIRPECPLVRAPAPRACHRIVRGPLPRSVACGVDLFRLSERTNALWALMDEVRISSQDKKSISIRERIKQSCGNGEYCVKQPWPLVRYGEGTTRSKEAQSGGRISRERLSGRGVGGRNGSEGGFGTGFGGCSSQNSPVDDLFTVPFPCHRVVTDRAGKGRMGPDELKQEGRVTR